jgi:hypothetical protein
VNREEHLYICSTVVEQYKPASHAIEFNCFRRNDEGFWVLQSYKPGDKVHFKSVDFYTTNRLDLANEVGGKREACLT